MEKLRIGRVRRTYYLGINYHVYWFIVISILYSFVIQISNIEIEIWIFELVAYKKYIDMGLFLKDLFLHKYQISKFKLMDSSCGFSNLFITCIYIRLKAEQF